MRKIVNKNKSYNFTMGEICMILLMLAVYFLAIFPTHYVHATDIPCGSTYTAKVRGEKIRCVTPTSKPAPVPVPTAAPKPVATPVPTPVPTSVPVLYDKLVNPGESIQAAINSVTGTAAARKIVIVKGGKWTLNAKLNMKSYVLVRAYPGTRPVIDPGTCAQCSVWFGTNATGAEFSGFEVSGGWDGISIHGSGNTVKNNKIHGQWYTSILVVSVSNTLIEGNETYNNGLNCKGWPTPNDISPRHCHDVYLSNVPGYCTQMKGNKIINNYLGSSMGAGVNFNGNDCAKTGFYIDGTLVEGNEIVDVNTGIPLWHGTKNTIIRNNSFSIQNPPPSDMPVSLKAAITVWGGASDEPQMSGNTYKLKAGYGEFKRY